MNLVIANSAQIAFAISRALNCTDRTPAGAYTNDTGSIVITSVDPGLIGPLPLQSYANGSDFIKTLPFIPKNYNFGIRQTLVNDKMKVSPEDKATAETLYSMMSEAKEIIFASNGGSDAQALFSIVCQSAGVGQKVSRMWLTTLSNRAIGHAYRHRESGRNITRIARSGLVNLGMNFLFRTNVEQALVGMYGKNTFPVERMDIAALWLLCNSFDNMKKQKPAKKQYSVSIAAKWNGCDAGLSPVNVWENVLVAKVAYATLAQKTGAVVKAEIVEINPKVEWRTELLTMATLQQWGLSECGFLPARTMAAADGLFEKGLISSPRTSVSALPKHLKRHIERRFPEAKGYDFLSEEQIPYCHGILTTERAPLFLTEDEQRIYQMIATNVEMTFQSQKFVEVGITANIDGMDFYGTAELPEGIVAELGEVELTISGASIYSFKNHQPTELTAASFLESLEGIANNGSDTPSLLPMSNYRDCGACLQRLIDNGFVKYLLGDIEPTEKARVLLAHTAHLELADIGTFISQADEADALAENRKPTKPVMTAYEDWIQPQIVLLITDPKTFSSKVEKLKCPKCGNHELTVFPSTVTCQCCGMSIPRHFKGYDLTSKDIEQLVLYKYTSPIYGFMDRKGHKFTQSLVLDYKYGVTFADNSAKIYS